MTIGSSIFLIALGAILAFAIEPGQLGPLRIQTVGYILMIVGLAILAFLLTSSRRGAAGADPPVDREVVRDPPVDREIVRERPGRRL